MKKTLSIFSIAFLGALSALGVVKLFEEDKTKIEVQHTESTPIRQTSLVPVSTSTDFSVAAAHSMEAVVHIKSTRVQQISQNQYNPFKEFFGDDFFFGPQRAPQRNPQVQVGTGSGVILKEDGYIVTNFHVIQGAEDVEVSLHDNRTFKATIVGTDPSTDLAVLKIEATQLPFLALQNSDNVKVGEWVLAVGNPFNLNSTVTAGIVSAKARNINIIKGQSAIESFIQTDAAVNPGNSGGALVDMSGSLIGINTAIASPTGAYSGYSFAVPSNIVSKTVQDIIEFGTVQRGYLGVMIRNIDPKMVEELELSTNKGIYIEEVMKNSSAKDAGMEKGDIILKIGSKEVNTVPALQEAVSSYRPGDKVNVTINRDGDIEVLAMELKNKNGNTELVSKEKEALFSKLGASFEELSKKELKKLGIKNGVKVNKITNGKIRKETNMRDGFIIQKIDGQVIKSKDDIQSALEDKKGGVLVEGIYENLPNSYYYAFGM